jgi:hypothetical protein
MNKNIIRVLRSGKNTQTSLRFNGGVPEHTLERVGAGQFLPGEFTEISEAKAFAEGEIQRDPSAILFIVSDNQILDEVMDLDYRNRKSKRDRLHYAVITSAVVFAISLCISLFAMPFTSTHAHILFTGGMTLLYVALLIVFGARNIHALIMIGIIFVMILFLTPAIQELIGPGKAPQTKTGNLTPPQR